MPLPGERMPLLRGGRPRKSWRWIGCFGPEVMLCAAVARIGPVPVAWWAVWDRERGVLTERMPRRPGAVTVRDGVRVRDGDARIDLALDPAGAEAVETLSPHGRQYAWTRKRAGVRMRGTVEIAGRRLEVDARGVVDDSAGYHARETAWRWSAGVGETEGGVAVAWNLVAGLHDAPAASERSVWAQGTAREVGPVAFAPGLAGVAFAEGGRLDFRAEAARSHAQHLGLVSSRYEQPFGTFSGELPGAGRLARGWGVMEAHEARW
jgi:hypothetical protein